MALKYRIVPAAPSDNPPLYMGREITHFVEAVDGSRVEGRPGFGFSLDDARSKAARLQAEVTPGVLALKQELAEAIAFETARWLKAYEEAFDG